MIRNVIFDWSGTLVDDLPSTWIATNHVFRQSGKAEMTLEKFRAEFCLPFKRFYDRYFPDVPMPQLEAWFHASFRENQDKVIPLPHARDFLEFCKASGLRTFLLSAVNGEHFEIQSKVTGFGDHLERCYVAVLDKSRMIHEILKENNLNPGETIFIGDMQHDVDTAHHGGIGSCAVLTGYNNLSQLRESKPDLIVEHLGELQKILENQKMDWHAAASKVPVVTVGGLVFDPKGLMLLVRTHKWSDMWGIPGGKTKFGETSEDALRREIMEETNLEISDIRFVLVQDCIHSQEFYKDAHFVLLNYTARCDGSREVRLNEEGREYRWLTREEALKLRLNTPTKILLDAVPAVPILNQ